MIHLHEGRNIATCMLVTCLNQNSRLNITQNSRLNINDDGFCSVVTWPRVSELEFFMDSRYTDSATQMAMD